MGFTPPVIPTQSSLGSATSTWANLVKEGFDWHESSNKTDSRPYAILQQTSSQTLTAATFIPITFDTEIADVGNGHTGSSATYTIPTAGLWAVAATASYASTVTTNVIQTQITLNGGSTVVGDTRLGIGAIQQFTVFGMLVCAAGDTIQLAQKSTAASTTDVSTAKPTLYCYRLNS